ncbi:cell wall protein [Paenibacillus sp. PK3_47]|uniref:collagen binding domain-containing protein n=1 Tax=Paenibacillus sp. PK3_47 TaxID=2072642 RepID=UPI00201DA140|nr:collagen binding domain-containing protein [Paenibacillus sp. PK3_47]UQZ32463.1 cell wall protein [Paenibacillus sp. PK3_47]
MVKRRVNIAIVFLMLIVQVAYSIGFTTQATAAGIEADRDIITSVSMAVYGPDGQTVTGDVYDVESTVSLDYTWSLPDGHGYVSGDTFTLLLPEQFQLYNDIGGTLVSDDGEVGSFTVSQSTHQVVMTFNGYIENHANVQGTLRINTKFDKTKIPGSGVEEILFPVNGGTQSIVVSFRPEVGSTIEKQGSSSGYNASTIQWTVDVNKKLETVAGAAVTDPIPAGLAMDSTVTLAVYALTVQLDGSVVQGAPVDSSKYTAEVSDGVLQVRFTDSAISSAYRIAYTTAISSETKHTFTNTATFTGEGRTPASSSATVTVERGGTLKKMSAGYEWNTQTVSWAIEYNYNSKSIPQVNAVLEDLFDESHELIAGSLKVYPVVLNSAGNAVKGQTLTENTDYSVTDITAAGKKGFKLQFANDLTSPYRIEYKIKAADRVFEDTVITNTVTEGTYSSSATQLVRPAIIYKNLSGIDYKNKTTDWKITFNFDGYPMDNVVVTDSFPSGGQKFVPDSIVVRDSKGKVLDSSAYTLDYKTPVEPNASFTVKFASAISGYYTITYQTQFSNDWLTGSSDNFLNRARIDWIDSKGIARWTHADGLFIPRAEVKKNGFKTGSYNAAAKEITWTVGANYNGKEIADPVLTDLLTAGQTLVPGSLKIYDMNIDTKGNSTKGSEISNTAYTYTVSSSNELKVEFADAINKPYFIEFNTSLAGQLIDKMITNTAQLRDGAKKVSKDLTATLEIRHGGEYIYKNGLQNGDKVNWSIAINRTQSFVKDAKIVDVPSTNQILLPDTFHLYPTAVSAAGEVTKSGPKLVKDIDYTLNLITDAAGNRSFELSFTRDISTAFILEYQSLIVANTGDKLVNTVNFSGNNAVLVEKDTSTEVIVGVSSGSGTGSGERGSLAVKKVDAVNVDRPLAGAVFELYRVNGTERVLVNTVTTDAEGSAVFNNLWLGGYVLIEKAAPQGYLLDGKEYPVTIGSAARVNLTVLNAEEVPVPTTTPTPVPTESAAPTESPGGGTVTPAPTEGPVATSTASPVPTSPVTPGVPGGTPTSGTTGPVVPGVIVDDDEIPGGAVPVPAATPSPAVTPSTPLVPGEEIATDDDIPLGGVDIEDDGIPQGGVDIEDDDIPQGTVTNQAGGMLPQTGENSPMPIYLTGMALILAGVILSRVFKRGNKQE